MTQHAALYRKYRPQSFAEVRDQDHIIRVLEGAIRKEEIPHALLFSGTRGTGKTTMARIFAQALGTKSVDLYEIDAASNRGIDDIRELKEAVHTLPFESKYKVYIIDEVHMLTKEAFNALLKTLEEPPAHVIFILATTEEEKLLDTILSRCQVFRFRSPARKVLADTVIDIAGKEGYIFSADAADLVALAADGSFRDALGTTQKVMLAAAGTTLEVDEVALIVGAPRTQVLADLIEALNTGDTAGGLGALTEAVAAHVNMKLFARQLLEYLRLILIARYDAARATTLLESTPEHLRAALLAIAKTAASPINSHLLLRFLSATGDIAFSPLPHLPLELAIIDSTVKK